MSQALLITAILATLLALLLGLLFAYWITRPLQRLAQHIARLAPPHLDEPATVEGPREVRQLATSFNTMSQRLAEGERLRRQMTSDVAHELRTPVTGLRGHLEAMMDGSYPLDIERLAVAYDQQRRLGRVVEDRRLWALGASGPMELGSVSGASRSKRSTASVDRVSSASSR